MVSKERGDGESGEREGRERKGRAKGRRGRKRRRGSRGRESRWRRRRENEFQYLLRRMPAFVTHFHDVLSLRPSIQSEHNVVIVKVNDSDGREDHNEEENEEENHRREEYISIGAPSLHNA